MTEKEIDRIFNKYERAYVFAPQPFGVPDEAIAQVLREHMRRGERVPDDYDWYPDLPPGADV